MAEISSARPPAATPDVTDDATRDDTVADSGAWLARASYAALGIAVLGFALASARWLVQQSAIEGPRAVYTSLERHFYLSDALLGFTRTEDAWVWLGLDTLGALAAGLVAVGITGWLARRYAGDWPRAARGAVVASTAIAIAMCVPALWAFTSGLPPDGAHASVPELDGASAGDVDGAFDDGIAGRYEVMPHDTNTLVARVSAGGETFDTTFEAPTGHVVFDPTDITGTKSESELSVEVASLDTGVDLRSEHARDYLKASTHPRLGLSLASIDGARVSEDGRTVSLEGTATLRFMGEEVTQPFAGRLVQLDADDRERLDIDVDDEASAPTVYLLQASFTFDMRGTPLEADLDSFDSPTIPIDVRVLLALDGDASSSDDA